MRAEINHIFFDLDNTLWDFDSNSRKVISDLFHENNLQLRCGVEFSIFLSRYEKINHLLWEKLRMSEITKEQLRSSRFYNSMQFFGYDDYELGYRLEEEYVKRSPYQNILLPDTINVLENLHKKYELHIITNGFKEVQYVKLNNCNLINYFSNIFISEEVGYSKPDKRIFEHAISTVGGTKSNSIMIGDDINVDVNAAKNFGMRAIHLDNKCIFKDEEIGTIRVNGLKQILEHL